METINVEKCKNSLKSVQKRYRNETNKNADFERYDVELVEYLRRRIKIWKSKIRRGTKIEKSLAN